MKMKGIFFISVVCIALTGCTVNRIEAFKLSATNLKEREIQSREYRQIKEDNILAASAAVLQDMGYAISESETRLGVITAKKLSDARSKNGFEALKSLFTDVLSGQLPYFADKQEFTIMLVVLPRGNSDVFTVRMTIQRVVWDIYGYPFKSETIKLETVYKDFFSKLSKAIFLEKNL